MSGMQGEDVRGTDGIRSERGIRRFSWSTPPEPGESLIGYVTRMAAENGYPHTVQALAAVGIRTAYPESIRDGGADVVATLADAFRQDPSVIERMVHRRLKGAGGGDLITFYGSEIKRKFRAGKVRRVSPRTLRQEPWHHAIWEIKPLAYCPHSLEVLLDHCPVCLRALNWQRSMGPHVCQYCLDERYRPTVDLREYDQTVVDARDADALSFVASLISPSQEVRSTSRSRLRTTLKDLSNSDLFELAVVLGSCLVPPSPNGRGLTRMLTSKDRFKQLTPELLAAAGRVLLDWPTGLAELSDRSMDASGGVGMELNRSRRSPVESISASRERPARVRRLVAEGIVASRHDLDLESAAAASAWHERSKIQAKVDSPYIAITSAARRYRLSEKCLRRLAASRRATLVELDRGNRPRLFLKAELEEMLEHRGNAVGRHDLALSLGVPVVALDAMLAAGLLRGFDHPVVELLREDVYYDKTSADRLGSDLRKRCVPLSSSSRSEALTLQEAARRTGLLAREWAMVFEAMLGDRIRIAWHDGEDRLSRSLIVRQPRAFEALLRSHRSDALSSADDVSMPMAALSTTYDIPLDVVRFCVRSGIFGDPDTGTATEAQAIAFKDAYVLVREISTTTGWASGQVVERLQRAGIQPAFEFDLKLGKTRRIYRREEAAEVTGVSLRRI